MICIKLSDYFVPMVLKVSESFRSHRVVKRDGEKMVSYVSRFREAASKCNDGAFLSRSLRDQFVSGFADVENQRKLLEVERDFDACIKIALPVEVASKESVSFKSSSAGVNFEKKPDSAEKYKGKKHNKLSDVCSYCNKNNHTAQICFKRIREEKSKGHKPTCYNMFNVSGTTAPLLVNVKIYNKIVTMDADSGATISVMSVDNFIKLNISDYTTCETYDIVRSVTGTQQVLSLYLLPCIVKHTG